MGVSLYRKHVNTGNVDSVLFLVIDNYPRRTSNSHLRYSVNIEPIPVLIRPLLTNFSPIVPQISTP
jgi:hypothetical protein